MMGLNSVQVQILFGSNYNYNYNYNGDQVGDLGVFSGPRDLLLLHQLQREGQH